MDKNKISKPFIKHLWWSMYTDILKIEDKVSKEKAKKIMQDIKRSKTIKPSLKQKIKLFVLEYKV